MAWNGLADSSIVPFFASYGVVELTELLLIAKIKPSVNQIRYHAYNAEANAPTLALCGLNDIVIEAYSSLSPITKVSRIGFSSCALCCRRCWTQGRS